MSINPESEDDRRSSWPAWLRRPFRNALFGLVRRIARSEEGREILAAALNGLQAIRPPDLPPAVEPPYPDLGASAPASDGTGAVIITGRFRSGSTLLWNLFRHLDGFTAYYEPHNERRWFDPATRGSRTDPTHRHVAEYWAEYEGLTELSAHHRQDWTTRNLYMDAHSWDPDLLAYTRILLARAQGRPALQCNRIDFRLGWHRRHFPRATIVHLYRHPRDQWISSLHGDAFPTDGTVEAFASCDRFYLLAWCKDLRHHFPFLDPRTARHPYSLFYLVWKLSYLFGRRHADHSLALEDLLDRPDGAIHELLLACDIDPAAQDLPGLKALISPPERGRWRKYAPEEWFQRHEADAEQVLADFAHQTAGGPLALTGAC